MALAIGLAALVAATSAGVILARSGNDGERSIPTRAASPHEQGQAIPTLVELLEPATLEHGQDGLLISFSSCEDLLDTVRSEAADNVGPYGWDGTAYGSAGNFGRVLADDGLVVEEAAPAEAPSAALEAESLDSIAAETGVDFSVTNVQERGIDEPDFVKTDGKTIYVVSQSALYAVDATGSEPKILSRLELQTWGAQLLLIDDRLLVIGQGGYQDYLPVEPAFDDIAPYGGTGTTLSLIDASFPASLSVIETLTVEGAFITARQTGKSVRLVTSSFPEALPFIFPEESGFVPELAAALENQRIVAESGASDWLPEYVRQDLTTGASESGLAVGCSSVQKPVEDSGVGMLSVLTIDPAKSLSPVDSDGVMTSAQTVYASAEGLYVTSPIWSAQDAIGEDFIFGGREQTLIHRFDIAAEFDTEYTGSGEVRGSLLNQFSMSEHDGYLRVATTDHSDQESYVTVLDTRGDGLRPVGRVGNLGLGEQIYAVRFMGTTGYVVTFRQVDPLYTIDLTNPEKPEVLGELKIKGYSAYLHPVGEGLLLGIGQDADENGRTKGTQLSLFDVSNLADPIRLHQARLGENSSSEAEYDHHAFLWWPSLKMAVLPVNAYRYDERTGQEDWFSGAVGAQVDRDSGITSLGALTHPQGSQIRRSVVIGDTLYTISDTGLKASALETFADRGWLPLG